MFEFNPFSSSPDRVGHLCLNKDNGVEVKKTEVGDTATRIDTPEGSQVFMIRHIEAGATLWIGGNKDITANGDDVFPMLEGDIISFYLQDNNENEIYAIVSSGTVEVYVIGAVKL